MDDPPPPPPPPMDDDSNLPPPPPPMDDDDDSNPPPPPPPADDDGSPASSSSQSPKSLAATSKSPVVPNSVNSGNIRPEKILIERTEATHVESDFRILIREMKRLVGAPDDDESACPPEPYKKCTWEAIYMDSYMDSYFGERLSSVLSSARKQKIVLFAPERLVRGVKKDADVTLITYQVPKDLKGAGAYQKAVAKAEERAAANARKADEMRKKLKEMKTTVGELIEEVEIVEEEEEGDDDDKIGDEDDVPPPPPPPDDDDEPAPPPPPDDEDEPAPPPPPPDDDDEPAPPPPPED